MDSVITKIRSGWSKFRDLVPLLASEGLPLVAKVYFASVHGVMLYGSEVWTVKEKYMIRLERDNAKMLKWIAADKLRTRLKLDSMWE